MADSRWERRDAAAETVDVGEVARTIARSWRTVVAGALVGLLVGVALVLFFPARWSAVSTVLLRNANDPTGSLLSRFGLPGDLGGAGGAIGNVLKSPLETEVQILSSRDVLGEAVDSLGLQARVLAPSGTPSRLLLVPARYPGSFRRFKMTFAQRSDGAYDVTGKGASVVAHPGQPVRLPVVGTVTLQRGALPERFRIQFEDREDAVERLGDRLDVEKKGGEVVELDYSGPDSITAAEGANAVVAAYFARRRTVDRGLNQRRYEFLTLQADSVAAQLRSSEQALRRQQERTGVFDPELSGKAGVDGLLVIREQLGALQGEQIALRDMLAQVDRGRLTPRQVAAFPSFLRSPAINSILAQMTSLETDRTRLLERRTEKDPEVMALRQSIEQLEQQLLPIGRAYSTSLDRQVAELERQQAVIQRDMAALPGQAEGNLRQQRDVKRLTQTMLAMQAQIVDARLAAIGEGGQVRQIDAAQAPKKPFFPRPLPTIVVAMILGVLGGMAWAVVRGAVSTVVRTPSDVERASGLPALAWQAGHPLLVGPSARSGTLLLLPVGAAHDASVAARQLAEQARECGQSAALVDLAAESSPSAAARAVAVAEGAHPLVVVAARPLDDPRTAAVLEAPRAALLVARSGGVRRAALAETAATLARLSVPCVGVVLASADGTPAVARAAGSLAPAPVAGALARRAAAAHDAGAPS